MPATALAEDSLMPFPREIRLGNYSPAPSGNGWLTVSFAENWPTGRGPICARSARRAVPGHTAPGPLTARAQQLPFSCHLALDPAGDRLVAFPRRDQRITGLRPRVPHHVVQPLGVDD